MLRPVPDLLPELLPPRGYVAPGEVVVADDAADAVAELRVLVAGAVAAALAGRHAEALQLLDRAQPAGSSPAGRLLIGMNRAQALLEAGELALADDEAAAALRLARREKQDRWVALASLCAALVALARGRRADARTRLGDAVRLFARAGDPLRQVQCHYLLGEIAYLGEDPIRAGAHYRDALGVAREADAQEWIELLTLRFEHR
jgi:tetratricopeptide (TPR) repeat protein